MLDGQEVECPKCSKKMSYVALVGDHVKECLQAKCQCPKLCGVELTSSDDPLEHL